MKIYLNASIFESRKYSMNFRNKSLLGAGGGTTIDASFSIDIVDLFFFNLRDRF